MQQPPVARPERDAATEARGLVTLPTDNVLRPLSLVRKGGSFTLASDPLAGKVAWTVRRGAATSGAR